VNSSRFAVFVAVVIACTLGILMRSAQVGLVQHDQWVQTAGSQQGTEMVYTTPRGQIRSSDGALLATSVRRWAVQVDTRRLDHPELFAAAVAPLLDRDPRTVADRLRRGPRYVWLAKNLTGETADAIRDLARRAVARVPMWQRVYPQGRTAAPLLGFARYQELQLEGATGLELYYEDSLAGDPERWMVVADAHGRPLRPARQVHPGRPGSDLDLTIDTRIQRAAERELEAALEQYGATGGAVVVLEAHTGNLLALASAPLADRPDTGVPYDGECWALRPVQRAWEPGSTVKPFVAAAGLAFGVVDDREVFDCRAGGIRVAGHWIRDHADRDRYTLDGVIAQSSNTGIIQVAERIPEDDLWTVLSALGFGRTTGLGLGAESRGILRPVRQWSGMSRASLALGQELIASPLQLAMAYGVVANGGWLLEPRLVDRMGGPTPTKDRSAVRTRVMDEALARRTQSMLELVIADGTGDEAAVTGLRVAGKTGTAQRAVVGGFDDEHHVAWFAGFLPMPDPRWVVVVAVEDPEKDFWASSVAAPVFRGVAAEIAALAGVERPPVVRRAI
jgi:cell division protein FtsI (penicillin-binding protein 3)